MLQHIDAVVLSVLNISQAKEFYSQKLGFDCLDEGDIQGYRYARYRVYEGLTNLELIEVSEAEFLSKDLHSELPPFNFYSQKAKACHNELKNRGVEVLEFKEFPSMYMFNFKDPDGNILNVCEERNFNNPFYHSVKESYSEPNERIIDGVAGVFLAAMNVNKLSEWFVGLEGFRVFDDWSDGKGLIMPKGIRGGSLGIFMEEDTKVRTFISEPSSFPSVYFYSDEIDKDYERFKNNSIRVTSLKQGCFYFTDQDGNLFGVRG